MAVEGEINALTGTVEMLLDAKLIARPDVADV